MEKILHKVVARLIRKTHRLEWILGIIGGLNMMGCLFLGLRKYAQRNKKTPAGDGSSPLSVLSEARDAAN